MKIHSISRYKQGAQQIEIVISFVIFIFFLIFLFIVFRPAFKPSEKTSLLSATKTSLLQENQNTITFSSVNIDSTIMETCVIIESVAPSNQDLKVMVKKSDNTQVYANYDSSNNKLTIDRNSDTFFNIFYARNLSNETFSPSVCKDLTALNPKPYTLGLTKSLSYLSFYALNQTMERYKAEYEVLRNDLGIPADSDFVFALQNSDLQPVLTIPDAYRKDVNLGANVEVFSDVFAVEYFDERDGGIKSGWLQIKIW